MKTLLLKSIALFLLAASQQTPAVAQEKPDLLKEALQAYRTAKFDLAAEKYQSVLKADPKTGDAYAGLARTFLKQEKVEAALEIANKGVSEVPSSMAAHVALGEVYFRQAKMEEAEKEFLQGVNTPHPDARACLGLARLYDAFSLHAKARKMLERANQLDSGDPEIQRRWMSTLKRAERIKSLEAYLAGPNTDDADRREGLQTYLRLLKELEQQPGRTCRLASKVQSMEAEFKPMLIDPRHLHGYGLSVEINGQSSRLLLDTGASGLLISGRLAKKAGIQPLVTTKIGGIGDKGEADGYIGFADSIKIGELEFRNCLVEVSNKRSVLDDDGLIGADVFSHFLVTLDFLWQKLKLSELPQRPGETAEAAKLNTGGTDDDESGEAEGTTKPRGPQDRYLAPEMQSYTKLYRFGHELLIPTGVGETSPKLFLIDTGAMFNTISPQAAREVTKTHRDTAMEIRGISGSVKKVYTADKAVLRFSHFKQENQDLTTFDLSNISRSTGTEVSGILGFATLRLFTLTIDYRDGLVDFKYNGQLKH